MVVAPLPWLFENPRCLRHGVNICGLSCWRENCPDADKAIQESACPAWYSGHMLKLLIFAIASCSAAATAAFSALPIERDWVIGPLIRGKNYSVNMPLRPEPTRTGWSFDFPYPNRAAGHVHYVTFDPGSLAGKSQIAVRYRVQARKGTEFVPQERPDLPGTVSLYFQRSGDNWSARGKYNFYRWYAPNHSVHEIEVGVHEMVVRFDDPAWTPVSGPYTRGNSLRAFEDALDRASSIGLVFGSTSARGHGVYSTAPASFELVSFELR